MHYSPKISVVIPIYNVAPYLKECLDSVINQTYQNLQIILVNDGSTDESEKIAMDYLNDPRVELITTDNGGLSRARNIGLEKAIGEYIYFIDSDDYIDLGFIKEMINIALEYDVEFVCNEQIVYVGKFLGRKKINKEAKILTPNSRNMSIGGSIWRCLFAKSLIDRSGVKFLEGKTHEDEGFLYMIFPFAKKFALYCGKPYYYRQRTGSIMDRHKNFRSYDLLDIFEAIYCFYKKNGFLHYFEPPYFFLYECGMGYKNEREYLRRVGDLEKKLRLPRYPKSFIGRQLARVKNMGKRIILYIWSFK